MLLLGIKFGKQFRSLQRTKNKISIKSVILLLGVSPKELKAGPQRDIAALFEMAKRQK